MNIFFTNDCANFHDWIPFLWAVQLTFPLSEFKKKNIQSNEAYAIIMAVLNFLLFPINRANEKPGMANGTIYGTGMVIQK